MSGWMASAAAYLQRCHQAAQEGSAGTAYMEGLDPAQHLNSIAQARQALQVQQLHPILIQHKPRKWCTGSRALAVMHACTVL